MGSAVAKPRNTWSHRQVGKPRQVHQPWGLRRQPSPGPAPRLQARPGECERTRLWFQAAQFGGPAPGDRRTAPPSARGWLCGRPPHAPSTPMKCLLIDRCIIQPPQSGDHPVGRWGSLKGGGGVLLIQGQQPQLRKTSQNTHVFRALAEGDKRSHWHLGGPWREGEAPPPLGTCAGC